MPRVLRALDVARIQTFHFITILIAGMGIFTDSYDLFAIALLDQLLGRIYYFDPNLSDSKSQYPGALPLHVDLAVKVVALCGALAGQLFFGWGGDYWGRRKVYGFTLTLMIISSIGQGMSLKNTSTSVITVLCFWRFWLGFGIGGDYPLSATIMSEYSNIQTRGAFVAAVFAMQGFGYLFGAAVTIIVTAIFSHSNTPTYQDVYNSCMQHVGQPCIDKSIPPGADWVWRIVLMFGAVPAALTYYTRSKMPETARYTALVQHDQDRAVLDMRQLIGTEFRIARRGQPAPRAVRNPAEYSLFSLQFANRHGREMFGVCMTWFLLDITFYGQLLDQDDVYTATKWVPMPAYMSALEETFRIARAQAYVGLAFILPGYWFTVFFIDLVGRKRIQLMGFLMISISMFILGGEYYNLRGQIAGDPGISKDRGGHHAVLILLYGLTLFFSNFGPNTTTFIIPAELFPARLRSTCNGIASASGKAGAIVGTSFLLYASPDSRTKANAHGIGYGNTYLVLASCAALGFFVTLFCVPETRRRSLEDLSGENDDNDIEDGEIEENDDNGNGDNNAGNVDDEEIGENDIILEEMPARIEVR